MKNKKPNTFFICCCDNRIMPYSITNAARGLNPPTQGDLFILRNIGNLIPPHQAPESSVAAAIEYAIGHLQIPKIIVCGHSDCGGMKAILAGTTNKTSLDRWLTHAAQPKETSSPDELSKTNVLAQVENLSTHPAIAQALTKNSLSIQACWFDLDTDTVYFYDEQKKCWNARN